METKEGNFRKVYMFNKLVIKSPKNFNGWLANLNEISRYLTSKDKTLLCPILFFDPLGICIVMPKGKEITKFTNEENLVIESYKNNKIVFDDIREDNFARFDSGLKKIDYGVNYWLYNVFIYMRNLVDKN